MDFLVFPRSLKKKTPHSVFIFRVPADSQAVGNRKPCTYSSLWLGRPSCNDNDLVWWKHQVTSVLESMI